MVRAIIALAILALTPVSVSAQDAPDAEIAKLANQICREMETYRVTGVRPSFEAFRDLILRHLKHDQGSPGWDSAMVAFWNSNHQQMVCSDRMEGYRAPQPILKRVVDMQVSTNFFFDFFFKYEDLNVNAVEQTERGPETLLDWLYWLQSNPDIAYDTQEITFLIEYLEEVMNGKRAAELAE